MAELAALGSVHRHETWTYGVKVPCMRTKGVRMMNTIKSTSRKQGRIREYGSEGSRMAKVRADEQK